MYEFCSFYKPCIHYLFASKDLLWLEIQSQWPIDIEKLLNKTVPKLVTNLNN